MKPLLHRLGPATVFLFAPVLVQWWVVLDLAYRAALQWLKFFNYGGGGYVTVSVEGLKFFVLASAASFCMYLVLYRAGSRAARAGLALIIGGVLGLAALSLSPAVKIGG